MRLDELTDHLSGAAANPPKLAQVKVTTPNPRPILPPTSSSGARRPVLRSSVVQRSQIRSAAVTEATSEAKRTVLAQARKDLLG